MTQPQLPRYTNITGDPKTLAEAMRDIIQYLDAQPRFDVRTFRTQANLPFSFASTVKNPKIVVLQGFETSNPGASVTPELPFFQRGEAGQIDILALDGFTAGTDYTVTAFVVGE